MLVSGLEADDGGDEDGQKVTKLKMCMYFQNRRIWGWMEGS